MASRPTNQQLAQAIDQTRADFSEYKQDSKKRLDDVEEDVKTLNTFMAVQLDRQSRKPDGSVNWSNVAKQALIALVAALGIVSTVVNFIINGAKQ